MIFIYKNLISKYIPYLTLEHVKVFAFQNNIGATSEEIEIVYRFIKEHYQELLEDENTILLLKPLIRSSLFKQLSSLYYENKAKYL